MRNCPNCGNTFDDAISFCPTDGAKLSDTADLSADDADPYIGRMVGGRYRIEARLGSGGMGTVYRALHVLMEKAVAVKILRGELAADETAVARFQREAKGASRIEHENCVSVTDFGREDDGVLWLVMEHLEGETLWETIQEDGPLSKRRCLALSSQIARALVAAHDVGVVHRDLKPENIMVVQRADRKDHIKVLDFGLAKLMYEEGEDARTALTRAGAVFGTPRYMSPEQAEGKTADRRSDLYSFGVILYEMVTGTLPFEDDSVVALLSRHVNDKPELPSDRLEGIRDVDPRLEGIIMRCLQKDPDHRFPDAKTLLEDLEALAPRGPQRSPQPSVVTGEMISASVYTRPRRRVAFVLGLGLGALGVAGVAVVMLTTSDPTDKETAPLRTPAAAVISNPVVPPVNRPTPAPAPAPAPAPVVAGEPPAKVKRPAPTKTRPRLRSKRRDRGKPRSAAAAVAGGAGSSKIPPPDETLGEVEFEVGGRTLKREGVTVAPTVRPEAKTEREAKVETKESKPPPEPRAETKAKASPAESKTKARPAAGAGITLTGDPYRDGLAYLRKGDLRNAERALLKAVRARPNETRVHLALSDMYVEKGDLRYAELGARKALEISPQSVPGLNRLGRIQYKKGDHRRALSTFRTVLQLNPGDRTALKYIDKLR